MRYSIKRYLRRRGLFWALALGFGTPADSPPIRVGTLTIDQQDTSKNEDWCEDIRFNPGRFHPLHRPLGNIGRGRVFTYQASQVRRFLRPSDPVYHGYQFIK